jgi:hypothetical protein
MAFQSKVTHIVADTLLAELPLLFSGSLPAECNCCRILHCHSVAYERSNRFRGGDMQRRFRSLRLFVRLRRELIRSVFQLLFMLLVLLLIVAAFFYMFVVTAWIALDITQASGWAIGFGVFLYIQLWIFITDTVCDSIAGLYGIKLWSPYQWFASSPVEQSRRDIIVFFFVSYLLAIYGFALAYVAVSRYLVGSFNVQLDLIGGVYFSVATIATVGYGDIVAVSSLARLMVVSEILLGLAYGVFFFSIVASVLREKPANDSPTIPPS